MTPTYRPQDWEPGSRQDWTNGEKLLCAALPVAVLLATAFVWVLWKLGEL